MASISGVVKENGAAVSGRVVRAYRRDTGALLGSATSSDGQPVAGDEHYSSVSLLLHMDGTNGSTSFTDNSPAPKIVTANGNAKISAAQSRFGDGALALDGSGDFLSNPLATPFNFGTGNFTIEASVKFNTLADMCLVSGEGSDTFDFAFVSNLMRVGRYNVGWDSSATFNRSTGVWYHVAWCREGATLRFFADGALLATAPNSKSYVTYGGIRIGVSPGSDRYFDGYIDDLRITKGSARYTENFTPPNTALYNSAPVEATPIGTFSIDTGVYTGEVQVVCLDGDSGTLYNDQIARVFPV